MTNSGLERTARVAALKRAEKALKIVDGFYRACSGHTSTRDLLPALKPIREALSSALSELGRTTGDHWGVAVPNLLDAAQRLHAMGKLEIEQARQEAQLAYDEIVVHRD